MMRLAPLAVLCLTLLAGCGMVALPTMPSWVPLLGEGKPVRASGTTSRKPEALPNAPVPDRVSLNAPENVADRVIAVVNNDAITLGELQENVIAYRYENRQEQAPDEELASKFLNRLIEARLQLQEADREKITVEDSELAEELAERIKRVGAKSQEEFEGLIRAQGISMDAIKKRLKDSLRMSKVVRRKVALRISVTEVEIDRYFEANRPKLETGLGYHARHILIVPDGTTPEAWEAARPRAAEVRAQLVAGADFAELARQHSGDATAKDGGDLGTMKRGELAAEIEREVLALSPGELSLPYRSALGYHIFRLESNESLEGEALVRARQQIRDILYREKYEARHETWLKEIKQRAIIEVRLGSD